MNKNSIPPADAPDLNGPYNFLWFKFHHLENLRTQSQAISNFYAALPESESLTQEGIKSLLGLLDSFITFSPWLPDSGGGQDEMNEIIISRKKFELKYLNKPANEDSYWAVQEIELATSGIVDYMDAMCEDE